MQLYDASGNAVYTIDQAADLLMVRSATMRMYKHRNKIEGFKIGTYSFFTEDEVIQLAKMNRNAGRPNPNKPYKAGKYDLPLKIRKILERRKKL